MTTDLTVIRNYETRDELFERLQDASAEILDIIARRNGFDPLAYAGKYGRKEMAGDVATHLWNGR